MEEIEGREKIEMYIIFIVHEVYINEFSSLFIKNFQMIMVQNCCCFFSFCCKLPSSSWS